MSDLISRKEAVDLLITRVDACLGVYGDLGGAISGAIKLIEGLRSAELERKGKWIDEEINSYTSRTYCSECGSSAPFVYKSDDYYGNHAHGETAKTKFCPNCGARLEWSEHETD